MDMRAISNEIIEKLISRGADCSAVRSSIINHKELQYEYGEIDLLRSFQESLLSISVIKDHKHARTTLNQVNSKVIDKAIALLMEKVENSQPDEAYDISPYQEPEMFETGPQTADLDSMYEVINSFQGECLQKYPKLILEGNISHYYSKWFYQNSNGVDFQQNRGGYEYSAMFSAKDRDKISSFNYLFYNFKELQKSFWNIGNLRNLIEQSIHSVNAKPINKTFVGDIVLVPSITEEFMEYITDIHLRDRLLISKNSLFQDKISEKLLSDKISLSSEPLNPNIAEGYYVTGEGFKARNSELFNEGVLQNYLLSYYGSRKTGLPMNPSGGAYVMKAGNDQFSDMIASIDKGILLVRFSGSYPSINGDFSGVAKNSFLIENGKISFPVKETMISGNLIELFNNVKGVSRKRINNGSSIMPWLSCSGVTISC